MKNNKSNVHYIHYLSQNTREQLVGAFFIITLLVISSLVIFKIHSAKMFDETITFHTYMTNAQGISTETLVNISGIEVGKVSNIDIAEDNKVHIEFFIYKSFEKLIRTDSTGELSKLSLIGNSVIIITAGSPGLPLLPAKSVLNIKEPITTDDLIEGIKPVINNMETIMTNLAAIVKVIEPDSIKEGSRNLISVMKNLNHITQKISTGQGLVGKAIYDNQQAEQLTSVLNRVEKILQKIEQRVDETQPLIKNVTVLGNESRNMVSEIRHSLDKVNKELEHLPSLIKDTQTLLKSTENTLKSMQQIWPLSNSFPQPSKELLINEGGLHD
ncbi:MAG: MCE family protein [Methylococcales bacterium]|nr:MCE family protein [Methylococcales bacterium]